MSKELEEAKLFSENVDRMLAGEETKSDGEISDDLRQALDFAREMNTMRAEPSSQYRALLKERLLREIKAREAAPVEAKQSWWEILIRKPVWQTVTAVVVIAIISGIIWAAGLFRTAENPIGTSNRSVAVPTTTAPSPVATSAPSLKAAGAAPPAFESLAALPLQVDGAANKSAYTNSSSDPVDITITLKNVSDQPLQIQQYPPILSLMQSATMQPVFTFTAGKVATALAPDATVTYSVAWDQRDARGNLVAPGSYYLELEDLDLQGQSIKLNFTAPVHFDILPVN